jgi:hypothetical protein
MNKVEIIYADNQKAKISDAGIGMVRVAVAVGEVRQGELVTLAGRQVIPCKFSGDFNASLDFIIDYVQSAGLSEASVYGVSTLDGKAWYAPKSEDSKSDV